MRIFTRYENKKSKENVQAFYWDGTYEVYRHLVKFDPNFVGVLDDTGVKGKDILKVWNENSQSWEECEKGCYVLKTQNNFFTVKSGKEIINDFRRLV